jgi:hypothetical protein
VRTRLATLTLATLLTLPAWAAPALADQGPATGTAPGPADGLATASGSGSGGSDRGPGGAGSGSGVSGSGSRRSGSGSGSGGPGPDDRRSATGTSPQHSDSSRHSDSRPGLRGGPEAASRATASAAGPAPPAAAAAEPDTRARASAADPAPPVGSVADRREGFPRLSTAPGLAAVAGIAGGVLLLVSMVAAGFRARARLGRLG